MNRVWVWWSSGKDSAWALHELRRRGDIEVAGIVTTVTETFNRISIHGVRREILQIQAEMLDLPLHEVRIPYPCSNADYEAAIQPAIAAAQKADIDVMAFGDLFLADVRAYRQTLLSGTGIEPLFPLWGADTGQLANSMLDQGLEAWVTCVDPKVLDPRVAGRRFDQTFLAELRECVDPCGENGEFHTCVVDGPFFREPITVHPGEVVLRDEIVFADLKLKRRRGSIS